MKLSTRPTRLALALFVVAALLLTVSPGVAKKKKTEGERYSLIAQGKGHTGFAAGRASRLTLNIKSWSTAEELAEIREIIARDDAKEIRKALGRAREVGTLNVPGQSGLDIIYTRKVVQDGKTYVTWAADRPWGSMPNATSDPNIRYLIAVSVMELDEEGNGSGVIAPAIEPEIADDGSMDIARSAADPITLTSVTLSK